MAIDRVRRALECVALAMQEGDRKHGVNAWVPKEEEQESSIIKHAEGAKRHVERQLNGEPIDPDSGLPAMAHVAARALIALQIEMERQSGAQPEKRDTSDGDFLRTLSAGILEQERDVVRSLEDADVMRAMVTRIESIAVRLDAVDGAGLTGLFSDDTIVGRPTIHYGARPDIRESPSAFESGT